MDTTFHATKANRESEWLEGGREEEEVKALEARSASGPGKAVGRMCCSGLNVVVVRT